MINLSGELIGINTMNLSIGGGSDGIGLAVPSNLVRKITEQIIEHGRVVRGYVGLSAYDSDDGVLITNVVKDGPADLSGLRRNDIIININDTAINDIKQVVKIVASLEVNQKMKVTYRRDGTLLSQYLMLQCLKPIKQYTDSYFLSLAD